MANAGRIDRLKRERERERIVIIKSVDDE